MPRGAAASEAGRGAQLLEVEAEVREAAQGQDALERKLGLLETHQKEVHDSLVSVEAEAARMYQVLGAPPNPTPAALPADAVTSERMSACRRTP